MNGSLLNSLRRVVPILLAGTFLLLPACSGSASDTSGVEQQTPSEVTAWTCSMHPEVNLPEAGDCPTCGMDLIPRTN